ncbi:MAG: hypothetical protein FWG13_02270 [Leptospirales bacterium]|nr:hypothetical protein [Leptospirales bacterium]
MVNDISFLKYESLAPKGESFALKGESLRFADAFRDVLSRVGIGTSCPAKGESLALC